MTLVQGGRIPKERSAFTECGAGLPLFAWFPIPMILGNLLPVAYSASFLERNSVLKNSFVCSYTLCLEA